jgi:hypothetical protein
LLQVDEHALHSVTAATQSAQLIAQGTVVELTRSTQPTVRIATGVMTVLLICKKQPAA